jgi:hypothetical protein
MEGHDNICTKNGCVTMKAAMRKQRFEPLIELTGLGRFFRRTTLLPAMASGLAMALLATLPMAGQELAVPQRVERPTLNITGYKIDAEIDTATHHLAAKATVTFTAPENATALPTAPSVSRPPHPLSGTLRKTGPSNTKA